MPVMKFNVNRNIYYSFNEYIFFNYISKELYKN